MKVFFVVLIVCHHFVTKSKASSAYGMSKNKVNHVDDALGLGVNSTADQQYSESGSRRAIVNPTNPCYTSYFVGHQPPTGFRPLNSHYIKHICQRILDDDDKTLYTTMFDEKIGIAVYVGYGLEKDQVSWIGTFPRISKWFQDSGIALQGSDLMYHGNTKNIHKGHLVPAATYSFDCINMVSTFTYTNAVPQYAAFNTGPWGQYENRVREFAQLCSSSFGGDLFLLTGISEAKITPTGAVKQNMEFFPQNNPDNGENIAIPNSMWTAGCCVNRLNGVAAGGFAVIGNNVQVNPKMNHLKVGELQNILAIGIGGVVIDLFPGNKGCSDNLNQYRYEEAGNNPGWTKVKKL